MGAGTGDRDGLVLFAMYKRNITAIYTSFYSSTFEGAFAFHFLLFSCGRYLAMPRPTTNCSSAVRRVNAKMRKRTVLSTLCGTFRSAWNFDCDSESFCGSRWELDYFRSALVVAFVVLIFESCWVLQQQPFDQTSTGLWREKLDKRPASCSRVFSGVSLSFRREFEYLLGLLTTRKSKVSHSNELTPNCGSRSLVAELSSKFVPWVFRSASLCCI